MAKSSPEKLAAALRANLKRRKPSGGLKGPRDGSAAKPAPQTPASKHAPDPPKN